MDKKIIARYRELWHDKRNVVEFMNHKEFIESVKHLSETMKREIYQKHRYYAAEISIPHREENLLIELWKFETLKFI
jgi:hypothetical protein